MWSIDCRPYFRFLFCLSQLLCVALFVCALLLWFWSTFVASDAFLLIVFVRVQITKGTLRNRVSVNSHLQDDCDLYFMWFSFYLICIWWYCLVRAQASERKSRRNRCECVCVFLICFVCALEICPITFTADNTNGKMLLHIYILCFVLFTPWNKTHHSEWKLETPLACTRLYIMNLNIFTHCDRISEKLYVLQVSWWKCDNLIIITLCVRVFSLIFFPRHSIWNVYCLQHSKHSSTMHSIWANDY